MERALELTEVRLLAHPREADHLEPLPHLRIPSNPRCYNGLPASAHALHQKQGLVQAVENCDIHLIVDTSSWIQLAEVGKVIKKTASKKVLGHSCDSTVQPFCRPLPPCSVGPRSFAPRV